MPPPTQNPFDSPQAARQPATVTIAAEQRAALERIKALRRLEDSPSRFWPALLEQFVHFFGARHAVLLVRDDDFQWQQRSQWGAASTQPLATDSQRQLVERLAGRAETDGFAVAVAGDDGTLAAGAFDRERGQSSSAVILWFDRPVGDPARLGEQFAPLADVPLDYQSRRSAQAGGQTGVRAVEALDLMIQLNDAAHFAQAAMTLCNEIAARYACDRVSLGWMRKGYVRLEAVSHMEKFDRKMALVQTLEGVMEECLDQDAEVVWPRPEGEATVVREHAAYAEQQRAGHVLSLPLRLDGEPVAVLLCERRQQMFDADEIRGLRVVADQCGRRLQDLQRSSRWFGARWWAAVDRGLAGLLGPSHTLSKAGALLGVLLLAYLLFGTWHYRVEADFILRATDLNQLPAPFDGYIEEVYAGPGDPVAPGGLLLELNTDTLLLQEAEAIADLNHRSREAEKARAAQQLADMRINEALYDQAQARLQTIRYNLARARVTAPIDGIVVEGDLQEMRGAPVKKGDLLFTVAALDNMEVEMTVEERDIQDVRVQENGEITFLSRPDLAFPIRVTGIDPASHVQENTNRFRVYAELTGPIQPWWRPGMSGVARIDVGTRTPLWALTHRTVDFLRLYFWW